MFTNFFDTTIGPKTDSESYKKIAAEIKFPPEEILFLTDIPEGECFCQTVLFTGKYMLYK